MTRKRTETKQVAAILDARARPQQNGGAVPRSDHAVAGAPMQALRADPPQRPTAPPKATVALRPERPALPTDALPRLPLRRRRRFEAALHKLCRSHGVPLAGVSVGPAEPCAEHAKPVTPAPVARNWFGAADSCVGAAHLRHEPPVPCQDAALVVTGERPMLAVADGAGSSAASHVGAHAVVTALRRLLDTFGQPFARVLDAPSPPSETDVRPLAHAIVRHACGVLQDLADNARRPVKDFRCTLLVAIGGRHHWLWVRVGDGALVVEQSSALRALGHTGKGEYANETHFLGPELRPQQVQSGSVETRGLTGVAAMTDGAAERLVSNDGTRISAQLSRFFEQARAERLRRTGLRDFFQERGVWQATSGDDRALAVLASTPDAPRVADTA